MKKSEVVEKLGGTHAAVAKVLGITRSAVSQWGEHPPLLQQFRLQQLRPDLFSSTPVTHPEKAAA